MEIDNFGHEHPLVVFKESKDFIGFKLCKACNLPISPSDVEFYRCDVCNDFFIHSSCGELPREVKLHPFHPQHTLTLTLVFKRSAKRFKCLVCGWQRGGFSYHCSVCEVDIDLHCAHLEELKKGTPSNNNNCKMDMINDHPHPLMICDYKMNSSNFINATINCSYCWQPIVREGKKAKKGPIFGCLECHMVLDESCARLVPLKIQHPFHQLHSLTLLRRRDPLHSRLDCCVACGESILDDFCYHCLQCDLGLHVCCASLMPITNDKTNIEGTQNSVITTTTHPHPLIACHKTNNSFLFTCWGCLQPLEEDFVYVCLDCKMILHKACGRLPRRILEHPYHPEHPLLLIDFPNNSSRQWPDCAACGDRNNNHYHRSCFKYKCGDCDITLHSRCALPVAPLLNSQLHPEHPLAFLDMKGMSYRCNACRKKCQSPGFRCVRCNFNLHDHCLSDHLPPTFKSKCHLHPLTLTNQQIKDYEDEEDDSEFLCDACEKQRRLRDPTYYCSECHFVAHIRCILPEILPCLQRESSSLGNKLGNMKLDFAMDVIEDHTILIELDSQIVTLQIELDELDTKLEAITRQRETQRTKLDQLKKTRAEVKHKLPLLQ